jgi:hypothetical protein
VVREPPLQQRRREMKSEDIVMLVLVGFSILFTAAFGWGVFG